MRQPELGLFAGTDMPYPNTIYLMKLKLCYAHGADAVFFSKIDLDTENLTINAWKWTEQGLQREVTALPHLLEYGGGTFLRPFFADKCIIIDEFILSKKDVNDLLLKTEFAGSVIPSVYTVSPIKALSLLNIWDEIIVKPLVGARGMDIMSIKRGDNDRYIITDTENEAVTVDVKGVTDIFIKYYNNTTVIVQPRLNFYNIEGNIIDFRVNVSKNAVGKWELMFVVPRTSRGRIISNFSHGAYISDIKPTLEIEYGEKAQSVMDSMLNIAEKVPRIVEKASGCHLLSLGIDVGIDCESLNPYIIEVNYVPQVPLPEQIKYYSTHAEYFSYLAKKLREGATNPLVPDC